MWLDSEISPLLLVFYHFVIVECYSPAIRRLHNVASVVTVIVVVAAALWRRDQK